MGDHYKICDRTGFKIRAKRTTREWTGRIVRNESWEPRQPQDFVWGVVDDQTVPEPRPRQTPDTFIGPFQTTVGRAGNAGDAILSVVSSTGFKVGGTIAIILDNKDTFLVAIVDIASPAFSSGFSAGFLTGGLLLARPLPYSAASGNIVTSWSSVAVLTSESGIPLTSESGSVLTVG
jgi:hypothetical protein